MKRILITGGAGFIGSHTADYILTRGANVIVYDNFSTGKLTNLNVFHPNLRIVQGDILDYALLQKEINAADAVLHLAALPSVIKSIENPIESLKVNTLGFLHVLQAVRESHTPKRLVYASSAAVYGDTKDLPCDDEKPLSYTALSPYALEKANNERYAALHGHLYGIHSLGLRYFNVYGKRQDPNSPYTGVISKFIERYQKKEPLIIYGDGEQSRDFIHVEDVVRANFLALRSDVSGVLNIATGVPETLNCMISYIEAFGADKALIEYGPARLGDIFQSYGSTGAAQKHIDFTSQISLASGLKI